jgi:molybdate transport system substrate-binding protein
MRTSECLAGLSSMATRGLLRDSALDWQRRSGHAVAFEALGGVDAVRRIAAGEALDVAVLAAEAIDKLVADGRIVAGSATPLARSTVAIAVARGALRPAIESEARLRETVLSAPSIGYSTGPSGVALQRLFVRWGIATAIAPRLVLAPPGVAVGELVARGDAAIGFQQRSELLPLDGVDVVGDMPQGLEIVTVFSGGVCGTSRRPELAQALLDFIRSPAADEARLRHGLKPARTDPPQEPA